MTTSSNLWTPPAGTLGLDRSDTIASQASSLFSMGYQFAVRTVGLSATDTIGTLTASEVSAIQASGMAISIYQLFSTNTSYIQSASQGTTDGTYAAQQAQALGAPAGMTIWYDFEVSYNTTQTIMTDYLNNWAAAVIASPYNYLAGMYVGGQNTLPSTTISNLPNFHAYWMEAGIVNNPTGIARGFSMYQLLPYYTSTPSTIIAAGINIDGDVVQTDNFGGLPVFWRSSAGAAQ